jgi:two-component system NtrC family sensor kinase
VEETVALMKEGAFHVLRKPARPEELNAVVGKALEHGRLSRGNRDLKSRLDLSERLAMIGRLASGVAHELNNPLDGVRRYVRLTHEGLEKERRDLAEYLERAMSGLSRMAGIVRQLLTFSRNVVLENEAENLRTMLDEVVRTLAPTGSAAPSVQLENPYVDVPAPRALFQVFVNLLKNALDAVEARGPRGRVRIVVARAEEAVEVRVEDNGCGIAPENLRRVFEPFFTTKEVGKGTGLGLPISARIVERCGGTIRLESEKGEGTTVTVTLPLDAQSAAGALSLQGAEA